MSDFVNREAEEFLLGMMMMDSSIVPETIEILGADAEAIFFYEATSIDLRCYPKKLSG